MTLSQEIYQFQRFLYFDSCIGKNFRILTFRRFKLCVNTWILEWDGASKPWAARMENISLMHPNALK